MQPRPAGWQQDRERNTPTQTSGLLLLLFYSQGCVAASQNHGKGHMDMTPGTVHGSIDQYS